MSYAEYLAAEAVSDVRHEYLNGEVWAMAGGTPEHAALAIGDRRRAAESRCVASRAGSIPPTCGSASSKRASPPIPTSRSCAGSSRRLPMTSTRRSTPSLLVEMLSQTTEGYDRGAKAAHYRRIPSLREYVLVSQAEPHIEVHRRTDGGRWEILDARPGESIELTSLGISLDVAAVYANPLAAG